MRQLLVSALVLAFSIAGAGVASASIYDYDEKTPNCGEGQSDSVSERGADQNTPVARTEACEGEHWDGRDTTGTSTNCDDLSLINPSRAGSLVVAHRQCGETQDNNDQRQDLANGVEDAVNARAMCSGVADNKDACYAGVQIFGVGRVFVHQSADASGADGDLVLGTAVFLRDDSDQLAYHPTLALASYASCDDGNLYACNEGNALATVVHRAGVTRGQGVGEEGEGRDECTSQQYQDRNCVRDNTAVSLYLIALP